MTAIKGLFWFAETASHWLSQILMFTKFSYYKDLSTLESESLGEHHFLGLTKPDFNLKRMHQLYIVHVLWKTS